MLSLTRRPLGLVLGLLLFGCAADRGLPADPSPDPRDAPSLQELRNATYSGIEGLAGAVTLTDGSFEGEPYAPGGASRPSVALGGDFRVEGDMDGDGLPEAVVVLAFRSGGSGSLDHLAVAKRRQGRVENVATALLGDRVQIETARIEGGRLLVRGVRAGEGDAACCPGERVDWEWALAGGKLRASAAPRVLGRLSLDALADAEWVLKAWDVDEPAPPQPEVTLSCRQARFAGQSGCNRYFGAARSGKLPGGLSLGPLAGTRMACPEPESAVEARYLAQLGAAKKFGFLLGHLAISYEKPGRGIGTMLFDRRPLRQEPP